MASRPSPSEKSDVNAKMPEASACPFWNMTRAKKELEIDVYGNSDRAVVRTLMRDYGFDHLSAFIMDGLAALTQMDDVPSGKLNLTRILNEGPIAHFADMHVVDRKRCKVDLAQTDHVLEKLDMYAQDGIIDLQCLARAQREFFERDRGKIPPPPSVPARSGWILILIRKKLRSFMGFFSTRFVPLGEMALMMLVIAHRDRRTRVRIVHVVEVGDFILHGRLPKGWSRDGCSLLDVIRMAFLMLGIQFICGTTRGCLQRTIMGVFGFLHSTYAAIANRVHHCLTALFGRRSCANLTTRAELIEVHGDGS